MLGSVGILATVDPVQLSVQQLLTAYELVGALVGTFIAYLAYRGYRRNDSRPMLFIAAGFTFIVAIPVPLFVGYTLLPVEAPVAFQGLVQTFEMVGLLCIVYALRMEP